MEKKISEVVADFLNMIEDCQRKYEWAYEQVGIEDKRTVDLMHELEFEKYSKERAKIATKLYKCRNDRREYKDLVNLTEKMNWWTERNQIGINVLKETLGRLRREEEWQETRTYTPRVYDETQ